MNWKFSFDKFLHAIITQSAEEARATGSSTIEAQHLLLAIAAEGEPATQQILSSAGLDHRTLRDALDREFELSLSAAGVSLAEFGAPQASYAPERPSQMGASAKLALDRGFGSAPRKKDLRPVHVLLGILLAEVGTVPRTLALAGADRNNLCIRAQELLRTGGE